VGYSNVWNTQLTSNTADAQEDVGAIRFDQDPTYGRRKYKYVQAAADTTVANGTCLAYSDVYRRVVSNDRTDTYQSAVAGVGIGAITASYHGWIQIGGYHEALITDGGNDVAISDHLILHTTGDGQCDRVAAGTAITYTALGVAAAADDDTTDLVAAYLNCPE